MWKNNCFRIFYNVVMWTSKRYTLYHRKRFFLYVKNLTKKGLWGYVDKGVWIVRIDYVERIVKNRECG